MKDQFVYLESEGVEPDIWSRLPLGDTGGRNEAWLRDLIHKHPHLLPVRDIDPGYTPLIPLCTELRTGAGPIDAVFINPDGKLTVVETKLWRNPEARRKVVAQILDYARELTSWSYSDLQRQVSARRGEKGNVPFKLVSQSQPEISESDFVDATTRALQGGRFLLMIVGDGIREDVEALSELVNRNAASAFQFALVEAAMYSVGSSGVAVQMRVTSKTKLIERVVVTTPPSDQTLLYSADDLAEESEDRIARKTTERAREIREWWLPILNMSFDDPDQPAPSYYNNHVKTPLPATSLSVGAYRSAGSGRTGVYLGGRSDVVESLIHDAWDELVEASNEIPGAVLKADVADGSHNFIVKRKIKDFASDNEHRDWLINTMNAFVNALRPIVQKHQS